MVSARRFKQQLQRFDLTQLGPGAGRCDHNVIRMPRICLGGKYTHTHDTWGRGTHSATWMFSARTVPRTLAGRKPPETNAAVRSPPSHELALDCGGTPRHQSDSSHCLVNRLPVTQYRGPSTRGLCFYHSITSQPITRVGCSSRTKGLLSSPGAHPAQGPIVGATAVWVAGFSARHERWPR